MAVFEKEYAQLYVLRKNIDMIHKIQNPDTYEHLAEVDDYLTKAMEALKSAMRSEKDGTS